MKRMLLAATAGAAVLALGGTAVALAGAESPTTAAESPPTAGRGAADDRTTAPADDPTAPADDPTAPARKPAVRTGISAGQAIRIALARTGDARAVDVELEEEHGRIVWKVETSSGAGITRVDVDAGTAQITRVRAESGDGGDDH